MRHRRVLYALLLLPLFALPLAAQEWPRFEIGIMVGETTGPSVKYWFSRENAIDLAAGWSFAEGQFDIHGDYLYHFAAPRIPAGVLPIYLGLGALLRINDEDEDVDIGMRIPIGAEYLIDETILSFFAEIAPQVGLVPNTEVDVSGGIGIRLTF